jgi:hypothetical protein
MDKGLSWVEVLPLTIGAITRPGVSMSNDGKNMAIAEFENYVRLSTDYGVTWL